MLCNRRRALAATLDQGLHIHRYMEVKVELLHMGGWGCWVPDRAYNRPYMFGPNRQQSLTDRSIKSDGATRLIMPYALLKNLCCCAAWRLCMKVLIRGAACALDFEEV